MHQVVFSESLLKKAEDNGLIVYKDGKPYFYGREVIISHPIPENPKMIERKNRILIRNQSRY